MNVLSHPKFRLLILSSAGLLLLWFAAPAVWGAMPAWLVLAAVIYRRARSDDWLMLPVVALPFWWATGLAQFVVPILAGIAVLGAAFADPIRGRLREAWNALGIEKWLALAAVGSMLPSILAVEGGGRMFTYARTVGLTGAALAAMLLCIAFARKESIRPMLTTLLCFGGLLGAWTLCQLIVKGDIYLPLQRTSKIMELLPGRAGELAARDVAEIVGIKYEKIGGDTLVVRPNSWFVHAVATGAIAALLAPMLWRRIRHNPIVAAVAPAVFSGLIGAALVASLARGAFIGIAGALIGGLVVFWPRIRAVDWKRTWPSLVVAAFVLAAVILPLFNNAKAREDSTIGKSSYSSRAAYYRATLKAIPDHLLFGHGTQRDNIAAPLHVGDIPVTTLPDGSQEARTTWQSTTVGCNEQVKCVLVFRKFPPSQGGHVVKTYYLPDGTVLKTDTQSPDRDPPLGSHSTVLGVGYKYGVAGIAAFTALWLFIGLHPLRAIRRADGALGSDARALWIGVLAFGLQLPIYEYDYDSTSPYLFYLVAGLLLAAAARLSARSEDESTAAVPVPSSV